MGMFDGIGDIVGGVIGGGLSFLGGEQANQKSWDIAMATNSANAQEAQKNRDFQEQQRKTQYQTAVKDLMAAGLNPMLAYTQGGAGTTSGAQATMQQATVKDVISPAVQAYQGQRAMTADIALKQEQTTATTAQAEVNRVEAIRKIAETAKINQDEKTSAASEEVNRMQLQAIAAEIQYKYQATRTSSAQAGLTAAQTKNERDITAKTANPWWVNKLTEYGTELHNQWQQIRNKHYKGN